MFKIGAPISSSELAMDVKWTATRRLKQAERLPKRVESYDKAFRIITGGFLSSGTDVRHLETQVTIDEKTKAERPEHILLAIVLFLSLHS